MSNFFLIDHSLKDSSGHHCDYVQCVAGAAQTMGFETTLGTNRKLVRQRGSDVDNLGGVGTVKPVFRDTTYQSDSYLAGLRHLTRSKITTQLNGSDSTGYLSRTRKKIASVAFQRRREKFVRQFASDCDRFFKNASLTENDHTFLATVSELELMGLAVYLSSQPRTMQAQWHLQFHFNLFDGRPPEYEEQKETADAVRACFAAAMSRLTYHAVNFYTTSDELAEQYNRLGVGIFESLPYPIATEFRPKSRLERSGLECFDSAISESLIGDLMGRSHGGRASSGIPNLKLYSPNQTADGAEQMDAGASVEGFEVRASESEFFLENGPIKITCPGGVRREKGHADYLQPLVSEIWEAYLATGKLQLVVQQTKRNVLRKQKVNLSLPDQTSENRTAPKSAPVVYCPHPLSHAAYVDLIKSTDIGLMFYDSRAYYSRRAGVLGELLASGKPVIVPAGCWLAEQIQEPNFEYADQVIAGCEVRQIEWSDFRWESCNVPMTGGVLSFDNLKHPFNFEVDVEPGETVLAMKFDWHWPSETGTYCSVQLQQFDLDGQELDGCQRVVGYRESKRTNTLFNIDAKARTLRFSLQNAFHDSTASIRNVELLMTNALEHKAEGIPVGSVGVVAANQQSLSVCVKEVVENLEHYRQTAEAFSHHWYARHEPRRTVSHLISMENISSKVA